MSSKPVFYKFFFALFLSSLWFGSSGKGMGRVCGSFQVQVPMGQKISYQKKKKGLCLLMVMDDKIK